MYKCEHFKIYELVDRRTYEDPVRGGQRGWKLFDDYLLMGIDLLREEFGPCTINDWEWGGRFSQSGYRASWSKTGAKWSDHRHGRAMDLKFKNATPDEVREKIMDWERTHCMFDKDLPGFIYGEITQYITAVEKDTPTWVHVARRNTDAIEWITP